jgi:hypothetical protein
MQKTDLEVIAAVQAQGRNIGELFLVNESIYWSIDAGDFQIEFTYEPYVVATGESEPALISLLKRRAAPEYESTKQIDDAINLLKEWEELYEEIGAILDQHDKCEADGASDFHLVEDCYGYAQHKVECALVTAFTPDLIANVQAALKKYDRNWEVIFALPALEGKDHAFSVYTNSCIEHHG